MTFHDVFRASEFVSKKSHGSRTRMNKSAIPCHGEHVFEACLASKRYKYIGSSSPSGCRKGRKLFFKRLGPSTCPDPGCQTLHMSLQRVHCPYGHESKTACYSPNATYVQSARFVLPRSAQVVDSSPSRAAKRYVCNVFLRFID